MRSILIIEDDPSILSFLVKELQREYQVYSARDGQKGIELAEKYHPDLVISDIGLPKMSGFGVLDYLRSNEHMQGTSFIFLTGQNDFSVMRKAMNMGADDFLVKPFTLEDLHGAIRARLMKKTIREQSMNRMLESIRSNIVTSLPHELRTSVMVVQGYTHILLDDLSEKEDTTRREMLNAIERYSARLNELVDKFYWFSLTELMRIHGQTDAIPTDATSDDAKRLIDHIANEAATRHKRIHDLKLNTAIGFCNIYDEYLQVILREVIDNAFKFSARGQAVTIIANPQDDQYVIQVTDEGRGMRPNQMKQMGAFVQFDRDIHEQQGTGLGLTICNRLVRSVGGKMDILSEENKGTTVIINIPIKNMSQTMRHESSEGTINDIP